MTKNTITSTIATKANAACGTAWVKEQAGILKDALKATGMDRALTPNEVSILWVDTDNFEHLQAAGQVLDLCPALGRGVYHLVEAGLRLREVQTLVERGIDPAGCKTYPIRGRGYVDLGKIHQAYEGVMAQGHDTWAGPGQVTWELLRGATERIGAGVDTQDAWAIMSTEEWESFQDNPYPWLGVASYIEAVGATSDVAPTVRWMGAYGDCAEAQVCAQFELQVARPVSAEVYRRLGDDYVSLLAPPEVGLVVDQARTKLVRAWCGDAMTPSDGSGRVSAGMHHLHSTTSWEVANGGLQAHNRYAYMEALIQAPVYTAVVYRYTDTPPPFAVDLATLMGLPVLDENFVEYYLDEVIAGNPSSVWEEMYA